MILRPVLIAIDERLELEVGDSPFDPSKPHQGRVVAAGGVEYDIYAIPEGIDRVSDETQWAVRLPRTMTPTLLLSRAWELHEKKAPRFGVYMIYNEETGIAYIGSSNNLWQRLAVHKATLNTGKHRSPYLRSSYTSRGGRGFRFLVVEEMGPGTPERERVKRENYYLLQCGGDAVYNTDIPASFNGRSAGYRMSESARAKIGATLRGMYASGLRLPNAGNFGETHPNAKLTDDHVREIRRMRLARAKRKDIATKFSISEENVDRVLKCESWTHLKDTEAVTVKAVHDVGECSPTAKLTDDVVRRIKSLLTEGVSQREVGKLCGTSQANVWRIKHGRGWSHVV